MHKLISTTIAILASTAVSNAALVIDTFIDGSAIAELTGGETVESTGPVVVGSGSLGTERTLVAEVTSAAIPGGESAAIEVNAGPAVLQIAHSAFATKTLYRATVSDSGWIGIPYDLAAQFAATQLTDIAFELDFAGATPATVPHVFSIEVVTNGGIAQYAGLLTTTGPQTLELNYLSATGTPDLTQVLGFELITEIETATGIDSNYIITEMRAIPEPTVALLGVLGGIALLRRRR